MDVVTGIVPAILTIIGSTEDLHLIAGLYKARDQAAQGFAAIDYMAGHMGLAVALSFITSCPGFLSKAANRIEYLWQSGLTASTGLLFNFLLTESLVPTLLRLSARGMPAAGH